MATVTRSFFVLISLLFSQCCFAQVAALGLNRNQFAYVDMPNPMVVVVENANCNSLLVRTDHGSVTMNGCDCVFRPVRTGAAVLTVYEKTKSGQQKRGDFEVFVKSVPIPELQLAGKTESYVSHSQLLACNGPELELSKFTYDIDQVIKSYVLRIIRAKDKKVLFERKYSAPYILFDEDTRFALKNMESGDEVQIRQAQYVNYKGEIKTINNVELVVIDFR